MTNVPKPNLVENNPILFAEPDISDADIDAVAETMRSGWLTTGEQCQLLEKELSSYLETPHVVSLASCTAALETAFAYLKLPPGSRVGVPTWTFVSSALAPVKHGAVPVLLDVEADSLNLSPAAVEASLADGLSALVMVHFGGLPVDRSVHEMCRSAGVPVVEDAAHALGAADTRGVLSGHGSVAACYSFYATKNLTAGEGGALATTDEDLAAFARSYRLHGLSADAWSRNRLGADGRYDLVEPGIKANFPDILAVLARSQLQRLDALQARRAALVARYRDQLGQLDGLRCVPAAAQAGHAHHLMVVVLPETVSREHVVSVLARADIGTSVHFQPLHTFGWFRKNAVVGSSGTAVADELAGRVLSLPLHTRLTDGGVDRVCDVLQGVLA